MIILSVAAAVVLAGVLAVYLVDAGNLLGLSDRLQESGLEIGVLYYYLYRRIPASVRPPGKLLVPGAVLYAVAATASASRAVNDWYVMAGHRIHTSAFGGRLPLMPDGFWGVEVGGDVTAFLLMDFLVEESIELLGAGFVLAATVGAIVRYQAREQDSHRRHRNGNLTPGCA